MVSRGLVRSGDRLSVCARGRRAGLREAMGLGRLGTDSHRVFQAGLGESVVVLPGPGPRAYAREAESGATASRTSGSALAAARIRWGLFAVATASLIGAASTRLAAFFGRATSSGSMGAWRTEER